MNACSLVYDRHELIDVAGAVALLGGNGVAFSLSPRSASVWRLRNGVLSARTGQVSASELSEVFDLRLFNNEHEVRWNRPHSGHGSAVVMREMTPDPEPNNGRHVQPAFDRLDNRYRLWGEVVDQGDEWSTLWSARVGLLQIPGSFPKDAVIDLVTFEYLAEDSASSNAFVADERFCRFVPQEASHG